MRNSLPYIIIQAQKAARDNAELKEFLRHSMKELAALNQSEKLKYVKSEVDKLLIDSIQETTCEKGCHYCCYHPISISVQEGNILAKYERNKSRLNKQISNYDECDYNHKACVFLDNGECSVYKDRPLICRLTYVANDPKFCHLQSDNQNISHLPVTKAALLAGAYYMTVPSIDLLPIQISQEK